MHHDGFSECHLAERIIREARGEALTRERVRAAVRVTDADVSLSVYDGRCHPAIVRVRRVRALLMQHWIALRIESELVPAHATTTHGGIDGVHRDDGLA